MVVVVITGICNIWKTKTKQALWVEKYDPHQVALLAVSDTLSPCLIWETKPEGRQQHQSDKR
jgi:hypothetical protein